MPLTDIEIIQTKQTKKDSGPNGRISPWYVEENNGTRITYRKYAILKKGQAIPDPGEPPLELRNSEEIDCSQIILPKSVGDEDARYSVWIQRWCDGDFAFPNPKNIPKYTRSLLQIDPISINLRNIGYLNERHLNIGIRYKLPMGNDIPEESKSDYPETISIPNVPKNGGPFNVWQQSASTPLAFEGQEDRLLCTYVYWARENIAFPPQINLDNIL